MKGTSLRKSGRVTAAASIAAAEVPAIGGVREAGGCSVFKD